VAGKPYWVGVVVPSGPAAAQLCDCMVAKNGSYGHAADCDGSDCLCRKLVSS